MRINGKLIRCPRHQQPVPCRSCEQERRAARAQERHARALEKAGTADAERRQKEMAGAREAGRGSRKGPDDDAVLCEAMRALHERNPQLSFSRASDIVGEEFGFKGGRRVRDRVKAHDPTVQW